MSGEKNELNEINAFREFYLKVKGNTKLLPDINNLRHGDSFVNENYNGYELSYLIIKYLSETLTKEQFKNLMIDPNLIINIDKDIITKIFDYYDKKLETTMIKFK